MNKVLTPGQAHDSKSFNELLDGGKVKQKGRGRTRNRPKALAADKAYSSNQIRSKLKQRKIKGVIPKKKGECQRGHFNADLYQKRVQVECSFNRHKQCRRIATRYEKLGEIFLAMWTIASIFLWL